MKLNLQALGYIKFFEKHTGASVKDCFFDSTNRLVFIIKEGDVGKAIGKKGINVKSLSKRMKKNLRIIEYNNDIKKFVSNLIFPFKTTIEKKGNKVIIFAEDNRIKGQLFGRDKSKLKDMQEIIKRYFDVELTVE